MDGTKREAHSSWCLFVFVWVQRMLLVSIKKVEKWHCDPKRRTASGL
mgnify:CR=1 FL=1|jgi:hypothetical protein